MLDLCTQQNIVWVAYFPLGSSFPGFPKVTDNAVVRGIAETLGATPAQVGLAWLLAQAPNVLLIPGTRSISHLEDNIGTAAVTLTAEMIAELDAVPTEALAHGDGVEAFLDERR